MLRQATPMLFVAVTDPERAKAFYVGVLGLGVVDDHAFSIVLDTGGHELRLQKVERVTPQPFTVLGWRVADIEATLRSLGERSIDPVRYDGMEQDALGIWTAPGGARIAWFRDPDGNVLSLTESA